MADLKKLKLLEDILTAISAAKSSEELLNYLVDKCIEVTGALTGSIALINPETEVLEITVFRGLERERVLKTRLKIGEGVTGRVASTGKPLIINNVDETDFYIRIRKNLRAELAVPLKLGNKVIGVISVDSNKLNSFTEQDLDNLKTISDFAVQILSKVELIEELKRKVESQNILFKIANSILEESLDLKEIFEKIIKTISTTINIKRGMLVLYSENNKLNIFAGYRLSEESMKRGVYEIGEGITGNVYKNGKAIVIKDISLSDEFLNRMKIRRGKTEKNSFFALPLKYENETFGVLSIEKRYINEVDFDETFKLLTLIASLVSNKVHNYEIIQKEREKLIKKNVELREKLLEKESKIIFIGKNKKIIEILDLVNMISDTDATVLVNGETGTGKEIIAKMIHYKSKRCDKPFVSINCAAIPENLLESELFGYKKGAFTGAVSDKKGKFLIADEGTIFLDEIGDLDFSLQSKILRVLQEKNFEPLGSEKTIKVDIRIISATNKNLAQLVQYGKFREDLLYRLNVISIELPSLSERKDDIPLFIDHFIGVYKNKYKKTIQSITERCRQILLDYSWPGNIRELENVIERAVILSKSKIIDISVLTENITGKLLDKKEDLFEQIIHEKIKIEEQGNIYKKIIDQVEKYLIEYALTHSNGNRSTAANYLGLHRNTLHTKLKEHDI